MHYFAIPLSAKFYIGDNVNLYVGGMVVFGVWTSIKQNHYRWRKKQNETESDNYFKSQ
ncbi:MAG: hypothetical protein IPI52_06025 [Bacteroidetes bacterium]|nr:hypothetical protein [Bacteroidota bacterium]